tara:strand:- start:64 stop:237 length:174 start_codon:yes stop_codon:yes gene_type:complete
MLVVAVGEAATRQEVAVLVVAVLVGMAVMVRTEQPTLAEAVVAVAMDITVATVVQAS